MQYLKRVVREAEKAEAEYLVVKLDTPGGLLKSTKDIVVLLLIGLWGIGVITFNFLGIIFLALGIFLLLLEIFEPGFGIFGFLGIVSIIFGIFTLEGEPFLSPQIFEAVTMIVLGAVVGIGILFIIIGRGVAKTLRTKPKTGPEALIGLETEVIKELNPIGQVVLRNEIWQAESINGQTIPGKSKVKIIKIEGNNLFVEKIKKISLSNFY